MTPEPAGSIIDDFRCAHGEHQMRVVYVPGGRRGEKSLSNFRLRCDGPRCDRDHPPGGWPLEGWCGTHGHICWTGRTRVLRREVMGCWWCGDRWRLTGRGRATIRTGGLVLAATSATVCVRGSATGLTVPAHLRRTFAVACGTSSPTLEDAEGWASVAARRESVG